MAINFNEFLVAMSYLIFFAITLATIGMLLLRGKPKEDSRPICFLLGYILFFDELWMFGIPVGHILPDLSDFHISGFHHWMFGLSLMLVVVIHFIFSSVIHKIEQERHYKVMDRKMSFILNGSLFITFFIFVLTFSNINSFIN